MADGDALLDAGRLDPPVNPDQVGEQYGEHALVPGAAGRHHGQGQPRHTRIDPGGHPQLHLVEKVLRQYPLLLHLLQLVGRSLHIDTLFGYRHVHLDAAPDIFPHPVVQPDRLAEQIFQPHILQCGAVFLWLRTLVGMGINDRLPVFFQADDIGVTSGDDTVNARPAALRPHLDMNAFFLFLAPVLQRPAVNDIPRFLQDLRRNVLQYLHLPGRFPDNRPERRGDDIALPLFAVRDRHRRPVLEGARVDSQLYSFYGTGQMFRRDRAGIGAGDRFGTPDGGEYFLGKDLLNQIHRHSTLQRWAFAVPGLFFYDTRYRSAGEI